MSMKRKFAPDLNPLETRFLLSALTFPDGSTYTSPTFVRLPRTGGVSAQSGTLLSIGVGQRPGNMVNYTETGAGIVAAEWNGGPTHVFAGIGATIIQAERSRDDVIVFQVGSASPVAAESSGQTHPVHIQNARRTSGTAVQTGSLLTITVDRSTMNRVSISNYNHGAMVFAEWNGGAAHSFAGVSTIIVNVTNGTTDLVGLHDIILQN
jgi:hypothetical protein